MILFVVGLAAIYFLTVALGLAAVLALVVFALPIGFKVALDFPVPPFADLAAINSRASSKVMSSGDTPLGKVALILP